MVIVELSATVVPVSGTAVVVSSTGMTLQKWSHVPSVAQTSIAVQSQVPAVASHFESTGHRAAVSSHFSATVSAQALPSADGKPGTQAHFISAVHHSFNPHSTAGVAA